MLPETFEEAESAYNIAEENYEKKSLEWTLAYREGMRLQAETCELGQIAEDALVEYKKFWE